MTGPGAFTRRRVAALVAAGVVAGGAAGAVISQLGVATASPSPSPRPSASGAPGDRDMFGLRPAVPGRHGLLGAAGRVLHGEATVEKPGGGTQVVRFQNGVVSAISGSTITVKSTDGFTSTFTVDRTTRITLNGTDGTLSKLKKDDQVRVFGVQSGSSTVAKMLLDGVPPRSMFGGGLGRFDHGFGHRFGRHLPLRPAPTAPSQAG